MSDELKAVKTKIAKYEVKLTQIRTYMRAVVALSKGANAVLYVKISGSIDHALTIPRDLGTAFYEGKIKDLQEQAREFEKRMKEWK